MSFEWSLGGEGAMPTHQWTLGKFETGFSWGSLSSLKGWGVKLFRAFKLFMFYVGGIMDTCYAGTLTECKHVDEVMNGA